MSVDRGFLLASDLHLTAKPRDAYRWDVFDFLLLHVRRLVAAGWESPTVVLAGDLVDAKDRHPASLVDPLVQRILELAAVARVVCLEGNHDYIDQDQPFFGFLDELLGVTYIKDPQVTLIGGLVVLAIPHRRDWSTGSSWRRAISFAPGSEAHLRYAYILTHQTFKGAQASNGDRMEGVPLSTLSAEVTNGAPVLSGDIHVPQKIGNVTYVGSPHPVCFGDDFEPRILLVEEDKVTSIPNPTVLARHSFKLEASDVDGDWVQKIYEGDQCKVGLKVSRADVVDVPKLRARIIERIEELGAHHFGTDVEVIDAEVTRRRRFSDTVEDQGNKSMPAVWDQYCAHRGVPERVRAAGSKYL